MVAASRSSVVYGTPHAATTTADTAYSGCLRSSGRRVALLEGSLDSYTAVALRMTFAGRFVALVAETARRGSHDSSVLAFDLRSGRRTKDVSVLQDVLDVPDGVRARITAIALNTRGVVAWRASHATLAWRSSGAPRRAPVGGG